MGLNIFQGALLLDTEHSKKLRKEGEINICVGGNLVHITLDKQKNLTFTTCDEVKEVKVLPFDDNTIIIKQDLIYKCKQEGKVYTTQGVIEYDKESDTFFKRPKKVVKIDSVYYR